METMGYPQTSAKPMTEATQPSWQEIAAAHARIAARIHRTPVLTSETMNRLSGAQLYFKCENLQKTGSFKIRGAANAILSLSEEDARRGIVTQKGGTQGAGVAWGGAGGGIRGGSERQKNPPGDKAGAVEGYGARFGFCA